MLLVKWLQCLLHSQKIMGSISIPPALLCRIYYSHIVRYTSMLPKRCGLVVSVYIYCDYRDTVFQIERAECNYPVSIGRQLAALAGSPGF